MKVFVYGTLQRGRRNHHVLGDAVFLGRAVTVRKFGMVDVGFPFALPNQRLAPVEGELFDIGDDEFTLMRLDQLEGEGRMYDRVRRMVVCDGKRRFASMYVKHGYGRPCGQPVPVNARGHLEWEGFLMPSAYRFNPTDGSIRRARRYVGSVRRAEDGVRWVGRIGQHTAAASTDLMAFREVAALAMGFADLAALRAANSQVRARNRERRAALRAAVPATFYNMRMGQSLRSPESDEAVIARIQREAVENDETPLTAEQIRATWLRGGER